MMNEENIEIIEEIEEIIENDLENVEDTKNNLENSTDSIDTDESIENELPLTTATIEIDSSNIELLIQKNNDLLLFNFVLVLLFILLFTFHSFRAVFIRSGI